MQGQGRSPAPATSTLLTRCLLFLLLQRFLFVRCSRQRLGLRLRGISCFLSLFGLRLRRCSAFLLGFLAGRQLFLPLRALRLLGGGFFFRRQLGVCRLLGVSFRFQCFLVDRCGGRLVVRHRGDRAERERAGDQYGNQLVHHWSSEKNCFDRAFPITSNA